MDDIEQKLIAAIVEVREKQKELEAQQIKSLLDMRLELETLNRRIAAMENAK